MRHDQLLGRGIPDRNLRILAAAFFVLAGVNHFIFPAFYAALVPPWLPAAGVLSAVAGAAEIAGGAEWAGVARAVNRLADRNITQRADLFDRVGRFS